MGGGGLQQQWGVGPPGPGRSELQAEQFRAKFTGKMAAVDACLEYTVANTEDAKHAPLAQRRQDGYSDYQEVQTKIDASNPAMAAGDIDRVLGFMDNLKSDAQSQRQETETAKAAWEAEAEARATAEQQVQEVDAWGMDEAADLLQSVQQMGDLETARKWMEATSALASLVTNLDPVYAEFKKQEAAKTLYDQERPPFDSSLLAAKGLPEPSGPMRDLTAKIDQQIGPIDEKVGEKDYVAAREKLAAAGVDLATLEELGHDPDRLIYLEGYSAVEQQVGSLVESDYQTLEGERAEVQTLLDQVKPEADDGNYSGAVSLIKECDKQTADFLDQHDVKKQEEADYAEDRDTFDTGFATLQGAPDPSTPMQTLIGEIESQLGTIDGLAASEDFLAAKEELGRLGESYTRLEELASDTDRMNYLAGLKNLEIHEEPAEGTDYASLKSEKEAYQRVHAQMLVAAAAGDYKLALELMGEVETKQADYVTKAAEKKKQEDAYLKAWEALATKLTKAGGVTYEELSAERDKISQAVAKKDAALILEDFVTALQAVGEVEAAIDGLMQALATLEQRLQGQIDSNLPQVEKQLADVGEAQSPLKDKVAQRIAAVKSAAAGKDYAKAIKDLEMAGQLVEDLAMVKDVRNQIDAVADDDEKDDKAREIVANMERSGKLKDLPTEARNLLIENMMDGWVSDEDDAAVKKIFKIPNMDPEFDELDKKVRNKIIDAYAKSPEVDKIRKDWGTMDEDQKKEAVKYLTQIPAGKDGWNVGMPDLDFENDSRADDGDYGSYSSFWDEMDINLHDDFHGDPNELLDTISHEIAHKYQNQLIEKLEDGDLKPGDAEYEQARAFKFHNEYRSEASSDDWSDVYVTSPKETHSRTMGTELQDALKKKDAGGGST